MINFKFNNRFIAFLTSGVCTFSLYGCSNNYSSKFSSSEDVSMSNSDDVSSDILNTITSTSSSSTSSTTSTTYVSQISTTSLATSVLTTSDILTTVVDSSDFLSENDVFVLNHFSSISSDIKNEVDKESFLDKGKKYFIYTVDFLFYDGSINGVKFSDLTDSAKKQLLSDVIAIDDLICSKFPNYKETIGGGTSLAFNKIMEIIRAGAKNLNDFSREKLGEENYNKVGNFKDLFFETAFGDWDKFVGLLDGGKQKIKNWYENYRSGVETTTEGQK